MSERRHGGSGSRKGDLCPRPGKRDPPGLDRWLGARENGMRRSPRGGQVMESHGRITNSGPYSGVLGVREGHTGQIYALNYCLQEPPGEVGFKKGDEGGDSM